ncbi:MAG: 2,3,4,5-tetrahydropyridine-2,6-dicarboxylate N-succinyltransferase [Candidatus Sumerlaeia bacterium]|nr:2,3,4,5-tetrahydropyridine-2,6-dicarboxylate N-succinyltransferase [Candidatus Sumerlaeia bacterium]
MAVVSNPSELQSQIERLDAAPPESVNRDEARAVLSCLIEALSTGDVRAASKQPDGSWVAHAWVKRGLLLCFRFSHMMDFSINRTFQFRDRDLLGPQDTSARPFPPRVVPGGTIIRTAAYIGRRVVVAPPSFINIGAYVDDDTMVDSHALVGSCAQIGKRVHLSAGAQIGGVIEPANALPVIIEDDVFIGGLCGVFEGTLVRRGVVLGAGVILTRGTPVYDLVRETVYRAEGDQPLAIPEDAVVVPGARPASGEFARRQGLMLQTPLIVKYRTPDAPPISVLEPMIR